MSLKNRDYVYEKLRWVEFVKYVVYIGVVVG